MVAALIGFISYRSAGEYPTQSAEDNSLDEAKNIEESESLDHDAITGKVNGKWTVDGHREHKEKEPHAIP